MVKIVLLQPVSSIHPADILMNRVEHASIKRAKILMNRVGHASIKRAKKSLSSASSFRHILQRRYQNNSYFPPVQVGAMDYRLNITEKTAQIKYRWCYPLKSRYSKLTNKPFAGIFLIPLFIHWIHKNAFPLKCVALCSGIYILPWSPINDLQYKQCCGAATFLDGSGIRGPGADSSSGQIGSAPAPGI